MRWIILSGKSGPGELALHAFTLIELMAASTVLSLLLLVMVGMQDQMSRAWNNANRRTDASREARAAFQVISSDLSTLLTRQQTNTGGTAGSIAITNQGLPFFYSSNGMVSGNLALPTTRQNTSSFLFGVSGQKSTGPTNPDVVIFGYYIGLATNTTVSGFITTNYCLYRYTAPNALSALSGGLGGNLNTLFPNIATNSEILARNTCNLRIIFYNSTDLGKAITNGANYSISSSCTNNFYSGSKIHVEFSIYPEEIASRIPISSWAQSNNIQKYARSFEFRVDIPRTITR